MALVERCQLRGGECCGHRDAPPLGLTRKNLLKAPHKAKKQTKKKLLPSGSSKINTAQGNRGDGCVSRQTEKVQCHSAQGLCRDVVLL